MEIAGMIMKAAILLCAFAALTSMASDIQLAWDASPDLGVTGYVIYARTNSSTAIRINVGTNLTAKVESLAPGRWTFSAAALTAITESGPSNLLIVDVPEPPPNMRTVVVQYSGTLTNFYDVGFFRLRLP
jgi:hypothetical protein